MLLVKEDHYDLGVFVCVWVSGCKVPDWNTLLHTFVQKCMRQISQKTTYVQVQNRI